MKVLFVWDFHGTLERNNVKAICQLVNTVLKYFKIKNKITLKKTVELYGLSWVEYFKFVYPEGSLKIWTKMKNKAEDLQRKEKIVEKYIKPTPFSKHVLSTIKKQGHRNIILTNSSPTSIKYFVDLVNLNKYFDKYIGLDLHNIIRSGKDISKVKSEALEKYLKKHRFDKIVKIGDRESDIKAGKSIGATTYYFRNQYNKNIKLKIKPDYDISDLRKILKEL